MPGALTTSAITTFDLSSRTSLRIGWWRRQTGSRPLSRDTTAMADQRGASCFSVGSVAGTYDDIYVPPIFIPCAGGRLGRAGLQKGEAVLDVATGPGTVARLAAERVGTQGLVVGADFSEAMIAIARSKPHAARAASVGY